MLPQISDALARKDYQKIVDYTKACVAFSDEVAVTVADVARGRGYFLTRNIILPEWLSKYDRCYQIYYAIHELIHCMLGHQHNEAFKFVEDCLLCLWDIKIMRLRVYPKKLFREGREIFNIPYRDLCKPGLVSFRASEEFESEIATG